MAALDLATAAGVLKRFYLPVIREEINNKVMLLEQVERSSEHVEGEEWVLSLHVLRNPGVGARLEGGTLPTAGAQTHVQARSGVKENTGRFEVTSKSIKAMASDKGSYTRAVDSETKALTNDVRRDVNRQLYGTSNGVIATCGVTAAATLVVLAAATKQSAMRQLEVGMIVDIGTVAAPTTIASARTITANDAVAKTITIQGAVVTTDATHFVFRSGAGGASGGVGQAEVFGLQTLGADSGTLFGVNPTTYPVWKGTVKDASGVNRPVTEEIFQDAMDAVDIASGEEVDLVICSYGVYREFGQQMQTLKRFPNTLDLKGGHKGLEITSGGTSAALTRDRDCPDNTAFGVVTKHLMSPEMSDWEWLDDDGAVLSRVANKSNYEATLHKFHDFVVDKRNCLVWIKDLSE